VCSEQELLKRWLDLLLETDPDLVIGYNIINFDLPYLYDRATVSATEYMAMVGGAPRLC
jgi:DNA polymerase elongation subunit (family B)